MASDVITLILESAIKGTVVLGLGEEFTALFSSGERRRSSGEQSTFVAAIELMYAQRFLLLVSLNLANRRKAPMVSS